MIRDKLIVAGEPGAFHLTWWLAAEQDVGGSLGDLRQKPTEEWLTRMLASAKGDEWDVWAHELVGISAAAATGAAWQPRGGWVWERRDSASAALKIIKAGVSARRDSRPMPEWATQALAAGWKPPKGWTP